MDRYAHLPSDQSAEYIEKAQPNFSLELGEKNTMRTLTITVWCKFYPFLVQILSFFLKMHFTTFSRKP